MQNETYIVQQGINMITFNKRPFDIRVMVQQKPAGGWETTGILARVAARNKIVTNYHNGGKPKELAALLFPYFPKAKRTNFKWEIY